MPFLLNCPSCGKEYHLPDAQQGRRVRCKDCDHTFVAKAPTIPPEESDEVEGIKSSRSSGPERSGTSRSSRSDPDENRDDPADPPKKAKKPIRKSGGDSGLTTLMILLCVGGVALVTIGSCVLPVLWGLWSFKQAFDEMMPTNTDQALESCRSENPIGRMSGAGYFANPNGPIEEPRRKEVSEVLEGLLSDPDENVRTNAVRGLARWGSTDNAPAVMKLVEGGANGTFVGESQKAGMEALARWQYTPGVPAIVRYLNHPFGHGDAEKALRLMGPAAEPEVLKAMNDPNEETAKRARGLLEKDYHTSQDKMAAQCVRDLKSGDTSRMRQSVTWLGDHPPNVTPARRKEVALALDLLPGHTDRSIAEKSIQALVNWATIDNLNTLTILAEDDRPDHTQSRNRAIEVMGKLGDARAAPALASLVTRMQTRPQASNALRSLGTVAEPEVRKLLGDADRLVRLEACKLLGTIGTKDSLPALEALQKDQSDKQVSSAANRAIQDINRRK